VGAEDHGLDAAGEQGHARAGLSVRRDRRGKRRAGSRVGHGWGERLPHGQGAGQEAHQAGDPRQSPQSRGLIDAEKGGGEPEHGRPSEQHAEIQGAEEATDHSPRSLVLDLGLGRLDEAPVRHAGRTHGLARPAIEAERQVANGRIRQADPALGEGLDEKDAPAGRIHLRSELGEGRAIREAQPAVDALVDAVHRHAL
jgi:hypothetical protein